MEKDQNQQNETNETVTPIEDYQLPSQPELEQTFEEAVKLSEAEIQLARTAIDAGRAIDVGRARGGVHSEQRLDVIDVEQQGRPASIPVNGRFNNGVIPLTNGRYNNGIVPAREANPEQ